MKTNVYYSALIVFMMSVTLVVVTSDKSLVEKVISPLLPHGMSKQVDSSVVRTFTVTSVASVWNVAYCDVANAMIHGVPIAELELMSDEDLKLFVNKANTYC